MHSSPATAPRLRRTAPARAGRRLAVLAALALWAWPLAVLAEGPQYVAGRLIVKYRPKAVHSARAAVLTSLGGERLARLGIIDGELVALGRGLSVDKAMRVARQNPAVLYAEPDYVLQVAATPNDPRFGELYGMHNTGQTGGTRRRRHQRHERLGRLHRQPQREGRGHRHRHRLHPPRSGRQHLDEPGRDRRQRPRRRRQRLRGRRPRLRLREQRRRPDGRPLPRHALRRHHRRGGQQRHRRGGRQLARDARGHQVPERGRLGIHLGRHLRRCSTPPPSAAS